MVAADSIQPLARWERPTCLTVAVSVRSCSRLPWVVLTLGCVDIIGWLGRGDERGENLLLEKSRSDKFSLPLFSAIMKVV